MQRMVHRQRVVGMNAVPLSQCTDWIKAEGKNMDDTPWEINLHKNDASTKI
jgi:outer membrane biogenesis lipoprotein LolB